VSLSQRTSRTLYISQHYRNKTSAAQIQYGTFKLGRKFKLGHSDRICIMVSGRSHDAYIMFVGWSSPESRYYVSLEWPSRSLFMTIALWRESTLLLLCRALPTRHQDTAWFMLFHYSVHANVNVMSIHALMWHLARCQSLAY